MINVTKTYLPPLATYIMYLRRIWKSNQVTNNGPFVQELENKLKEYLGVKHLFFVSNGTIALQIAIRALGLKGEVITTPFSYVASTSALVWEHCKPVFVDIDPKTLCIDPSKIKAKLSKKTSAILAVHVFGNSCDVDVIDRIAKENNLKVVYDAAHTFGVRYRNKHLVSFGDVSILSFHATKVFHTIEGGAVITNDRKIAERVSYMRNFGHKGEEAFQGLGINGKNSELHAAMGLSILPEMKRLIEIRKNNSLLYDKLLSNCSIVRPKTSVNIEYNYSYYPIIFESEQKLKKVVDCLLKNSIKPRRYFYPSLAELDYVSKFHTPIAKNISKRILCLPLYSQPFEKEIKKISKIVRDTL